MGYKKGKAMAFELKSSKKEEVDSDRIFFLNLSEDAQNRALEIKGIKNYKDENWDVFPILYHYEPINQLSQIDIDNMAIDYLRFAS